VSTDSKVAEWDEVGGAEGVEGLDTFGALASGAPVEVFSRFTRSWVTGFEIAEAGTDGYRVRRFSDRSVLPVELALHDVRAAHPSAARPTRP